MNNPMQWMNRQKRFGWVLLTAGVAVALLGILLPNWIEHPSFNPRIITGIGILLLGLGLSYLMRFYLMRSDMQAASRLINEQRDERNRIHRTRAGNRAYWVSTALAYTGLMWVSFASNGSLPHLSEDALWYFLAGVVVLPFGVYAVSLLMDEARE